MKKILFPLLSVFLFVIVAGGMTSCSDKDDEVETVISKNDLPEDALKFLNKYFYDYSVVKVVKETEGSMEIYEVELDNGYQVYFNSKGEWTQVVAPYGQTIPTGFIPEPVMTTLNQRFPGFGITEINTTGEGYKVQLSDNQGGSSIDIYMDMAGEIIRIDQMD